MIGIEKEYYIYSSRLYNLLFSIDISSKLRQRNHSAILSKSLLPSQTRNCYCPAPLDDSTRIINIMAHRHSTVCSYRSRSKFRASKLLVGWGSCWDDLRPIKVIHQIFDIIAAAQSKNFDIFSKTNCVIRLDYTESQSCHHTASAIPHQVYVAMGNQIGMLILFVDSIRELRLCRYFTISSTRIECHRCRKLLILSKSHM